MAESQCFLCSTGTEGWIASILKKPLLGYVWHSQQMAAFFTRQFRAAEWWTERQGSFQVHSSISGVVSTPEGLCRGQDSCWPFLPKYLYVDLAASATGQHNPAQAPEDCTLPLHADSDLTQAIREMNNIRNSENQGCYFQTLLLTLQRCLYFPSDFHDFCRNSALPRNWLNLIKYHS